MRTNKEKLFDNVALNIAGTATDTSETIDLTHAWGFSTYIKWTKTGGVVAGTIVPYKSIDGTNWVAMTTTNLNDGDGAVQTEHADVAYNYYKAVITLTNGQATFYGIYNSKGA